MLASGSTAVHLRGLAVRNDVDTDHDRAGDGPTLYTALKRCVALQALSSGVGA